MYLSSAKSNFVMKFGSGPWHGERFAFDGAKTSFAAFTSSHRPSAFGDFILTQDYIIKEGLMGGEVPRAELSKIQTTTGSRWNALDTSKPTDVM